MNNFEKAIVSQNPFPNRFASSLQLCKESIATSNKNSILAQQRVKGIVFQTINTWNNSLCSILNICKSSAKFCQCVIMFKEICVRGGILGSIRWHDGDGNENFKNAIG